MSSLLVALVVFGCAFGGASQESCSTANCPSVIMTVNRVLSIISNDGSRRNAGMGSVPPLLSFLFVIVSGWVHRHQLLVIEFLEAENQLLKERLRGKRIRFTDAERALLARKAKARAQSPELATCQPQFAQRLRYARVGRGGESRCPDAYEE
jgi:hypothetical protein